MNFEVTNLRASNLLVQPTLAGFKINPDKHCFNPERWVHFINNKVTILSLLVDSAAFDIKS